LTAAECVDHFAFDAVGQVPAIGNVLETVPAVGDFLVLGERVGDQSIDADVLLKDPADFSCGAGAERGVSLL
jgi:hypothetical protein